MTSPAAAGPDPESAPSYRGWRVVAACFVLATVSWGFAFYGQGVYLAYLPREGRASPALLAAASSASYLSSALLAMFAADAIRRAGARLVATGGVVALAAAIGLLSVAQGEAGVLAAFAALALSWSVLSVAGISAIAGPWFELRRGLALNLALTGASVGGVAVVPALVAAIERWGVQAALGGAALLLPVLLLPLVWFAVADAPGAQQAARQPQASPARAHLLRDRGFWSVTGPFALVQMIQVAVLVHQISFISERAGAGIAATAVMVTTLSAIAGRVGVGLILDKVSPRAVTAWSFASQALAIAVFAATSHPWAMLAAAALYGFSVGNVITLPGMLVHREFPAAAFAVVVATSASLCQLAYAMGPVLLQLLVGAAGGYGAPLMALAVLEALMGWAVWRLRPAQAALAPAQR